MHGKALREGGYETLATFRALAAADCVVLGGDVGKVICGSSTEFFVQPHDAASSFSSRKVPHQKALSVTVSGASRCCIILTALHELEL